MSTTSAILATSDPTQRLAGIPEPFQVLSSSVNALLRRLTAESAGEQWKPSMEEDSDSAAATSKAVHKAKERASALFESVIKPLRAEIASIRDTFPDVILQFKEAAAKIPEEIKALREKEEAEAVEKERKLREDRELKHAQTQALHDIALHTQIEKERLETALYNENTQKGPQVYALVLANVKKLQQQIKDLEVSGTSNRKNQGILAHTLRALEVRATKAGGDSKQYLVMHPGAGMEADTYKPSEQVKKKQAKRDEQEQEFRQALEAEVATLKRGMEAKIVYDTSELGANLRAEAEVHAKEVSELAQRLRAWREKSSEAKPWLGVLAPLAKAAALMNRSAQRIKSQRSKGESLAPAAHSVIPFIEELKKDLAHAGPCETPRQDGLNEIAQALAEAQRSMNALMKAYPDPEVPPDSVRGSLTRRSVTSDGGGDAESPDVQAVHPGKLRPDDVRGRSQPQDSPPRLDLKGEGESPKSEHDVSGGTPRSDHDEEPGRSTFEKARGLPKRQPIGSKALAQMAAGRANFANMGDQLNALAATLASGSTSGGMPLTQAPPPSRPQPPSQSRPQPPSQQPKPAPAKEAPAAASAEVMNQLAEMARPASQKGRQMTEPSATQQATSTTKSSARQQSARQNRPSSASARRRPREAEVEDAKPSHARALRRAETASSTNLNGVERSDKVGAPLRQNTGSSMSCANRGPAEMSKSASGTGFKAVQEARRNNNAWG
jgi:hypothetical protein